MSIRIDPKIVSNFFKGISLIDIPSTNNEMNYLNNNGYNLGEMFEEIFHELRNTPGSNDKLEVLYKYKGFNTWNKFLTYCYDDVNFIYYKSSLPKGLEVSIDAEVNISDIIDLFTVFDMMATGNYRGKKSDELLGSVLDGAGEVLHDIAACVLKRDCKCKIGRTLINSAYGMTGSPMIPIAPYMRCEKEEKLDRINYDGIGALAQTKEDGLFLNNAVRVSDNITRATTRYGRSVDDIYLLKLMGYVNPAQSDDSWNLEDDFVIHGEGLVLDPNGKVYPRQKGNGMINSFVQRKETHASNLIDLENAKTPKAKEKQQLKIDTDIADWEYVSKNFVYRIWDVVDLNDWMNLRSEEDTITRFQKTLTLLENFNNMLDSNPDIKETLGNCRVEMIDYRFVKNEEELQLYYAEKIVLGEEGLVVKNLDAPWMNSTNTKGIIKMKDFKECDLVIVGYNMADEESEFFGGIGSYICESSCGLLQVSVSGMKRHERGLERVDLNDSSAGLRPIEGFDFDRRTGDIIAVKFNEVIASETRPGIMSLFLPNIIHPKETGGEIIEIRESYDKNTADDLATIKKAKRKK